MSSYILCKLVSSNECCSCLLQQMHIFYKRGSEKVKIVQIPLKPDISATDGANTEVAENL